MDPSLVLEQQRELEQRQLRRLLKGAPHVAVQAALGLLEEAVAGEAMAPGQVEQQVDPLLVLEQQRELW